MKHVAKATGGVQAESVNYQGGSYTSNGSQKSMSAVLESEGIAPNNMDYDPAEDTDRYNQHWMDTASREYDPADDADRYDQHWRDTASRSSPGMRSLKEGLRDVKENFKEGAKVTAAYGKSYKTVLRVKTHEPEMICRNLNFARLSIPFSPSHRKVF